MFADVEHIWVNREESEAVSELKSVTGGAKLPYGTLRNGAEGIKELITNFDDARKSDIENERLPPELIDVSEVKGMEDFAPSSVGTPPGSPAGTPISPGGDSRRSSVPSSPITPSTPDGSGEDFVGDMAKRDSLSGGFKRGHSRQSSLGTTMTSPSTRRRSLENTMSMLREAMTSRDLVSRQVISHVASLVRWIDVADTEYLPTSGGSGG